MKRSGTAVLVTALMLFIFAFGSVNAEDPVSVFSVKCPQADAGYTPPQILKSITAEGFTIDIWFNNAGTVDFCGGSFSLMFYSPDGGITTITHVDSSGDLSTGNLTYLNDFIDSYMDMLMFTEFSWDGSLPDSVNLAPMGCMMNPGLPPSEPDQAYLRFHFKIEDQEGRFCIDSIQPSENNGGNETWDWLFTPEDKPVTFSGPYCWDIVFEHDVQEFGDKDNLPKDYFLGQNYPNPFNPRTQFEFALPSKSHVAISIYNVLGQNIKTLANKEYSAGRYIVDWDGTAVDGSSVASGIYFYKMEAGSFTQTKKLMLIK